MEKADGTYSANCHGQGFLEDVVKMVKQYLDSNPDPAMYEFLEWNLGEMTHRFGGVVGTTFRAFPSYPQRYTEVLTPQPAAPEGVTCRVEPLKVPRVKSHFTDDDLVMREFLAQTSRQVVRKGKFCAA
jgi:hypothetical protein